MRKLRELEILRETIRVHSKNVCGGLKGWVELYDWAILHECASKVSIV